MSGYIIYFYDDGKNMSFKIEGVNILVTYDEIWNKIKKRLNIKFYSQFVCDEKHIKLK